MVNVIWVMVGGFFGSISRYTTGEWLNTENGLPIGTLAVNLVGCLFLGWLMTFFQRNNVGKSQLSLLVGTGFTGAFTTFSTYSFETQQFVDLNQILYAAGYTLISVVFGVLFAYFGYRLAVIIQGKEGTSS